MCMYFVTFFFFQAEDGIRDLVRSRGLGDVYKRQVVFAAWLLPCALFAQRPTPAPPQTKSVLVTGGTVHVGDGKVIDEGAVSFRNGRIDYVGYNYGVTAAYDTVIDVKGQQVYPGFIAPDASLGLVEIEQSRSTVDQQDVGTMEPEFRAIAAYKSDSRVIPTVRSNGCLLYTSPSPRDRTRSRMPSSA